MNMPKRNTMPARPPAAKRSPPASATMTGSVNASVDDGRGRRVDPLVAVIAVEERDRLLHVTGRARRERGVHEVARSLGADAGVLLPRARIGGARERRDVRREIAHGVVTRDRGAQRVGVEEADLDRRRAQRPRELGLGRRTHERGHLVTGGDQRAHRPATEHSRRSGNEDTHRNLPVDPRLPVDSNPDNSYPR